MTATPGQIADELRRLATEVRRIGDGYRQDPEQLAIAKDEIAHSLAGLARQLEAA